MKGVKMFHKNRVHSKSTLDSALPRSKNFYFLLASFILVTSLNSVTAYAADEPALTDIFDTQAFRGSWAILEKLNSIGWLMNTLISVFCFVGLFFILYQKVITIVYFSGRTMWDNVYEIKNSSKEGPMGFSSYVKGVMSSNSGSGIDSIVNLLYAFIPDIKRYSEYNPDNMSEGLKEDDTIVTYFLKTFLKTAVIGLLLSMGFSGTLMKSYGVAIDGLGAFADRVVAINLESYVDKILDTGGNHNFTLGASGKADDKVREGIAKSLYRQVIGKLEVLDTDSRLTIGASIENWVKNNFTNAEISNLANKGTAISERDWKYVDYQVIASSTKNNANGKSYDAEDIPGLKAQGTKIYFHIFVTKNGTDDGTNFFELKKDN